MDDTSKLVIIKHYNFNDVNAAYIDQGMLLANGIKSSVGNPNGGQMFPGLDMITLSVLASDRQSACALIPDCDTCDTCDA